MNAFDEWIRDTKSKLTRSSIVFMQAGSAHEPARRALLDCGMQIQSVGDYLADGLPAAPREVIVTDLEQLAADARNSLGDLRAQVHEGVRNGDRVLLLSRSPRHAFPDVPGSSLLHDATFAHAPFVRATSVTELPACTSGLVDDGVILRKVLNELGPEICGSLDRVIYESMLHGEYALSGFDARELEALDAAGLTFPTDSGRVWNFSWHFAEIKVALDQVIPQICRPQVTFHQVASGLWEIERLVRCRLRLRCIEVDGEGWRRASLSDDSVSKALNRAVSGGYFGVKSVKQVRDPLEWLTLGELRELMVRDRIGGLGIEAQIWRRFDEEILPIRNRVAHMRLLHPGDAVIVAKWVNLLRHRLE